MGRIFQLSCPEPFDPAPQASCRYFSFARKFRIWRIFQLQGETSPIKARRGRTAPVPYGAGSIIAHCGNGMTFSKLGLSEKVLQAVEASGYLTPTPIQVEAIPH